MGAKRKIRKSRLDPNARPAGMMMERMAIHPMIARGRVSFSQGA
jgi:hypothetical protein